MAVSALSAGVTAAVAGAAGLGAMTAVLAASGAALAFSLAGSAYLSRAVGGSIGRISQGAARFALGRLDTPVDGGGMNEVEELSGSLNRMARELNGKINDLARDRKSREAIFDCLQEGVMAVNPEMETLLMNPAARDILDIRSGRDGRVALNDVLRNGELLRFIERGLDGRAFSEEEIMIGGPHGKKIEVKSSPLYGPNEEYMGAVIALQDVTKLRMLESLRRDFAANVSHELKTPITAIKGFVETMLSGAAREPESAERFLGIIARHVERLDAIVDDLLSLARIESGAEAGAIKKEDVAALGFLENARGLVAGKAREKSVEVEISCPKGLRAVLNAALMEQALVNLLDNAVNYSPEGSQVTVTARRGGGEFSVIVRDRGCGIDKSHLGRIFERFFRVDEARSRKLGGTGLGLSIVKHIALAHSGRVTVESAPGEGSVFAIHIPAGRE